MKKIAALLMAAALMLSFTACTSSNTETSKDDDDVKTTTASKDVETNDDETKADTEAEDTAAEEEKNEIAFTELIVVDNEKCSIKITGVEEGSAPEFTVKVIFENKTADENYTFVAENIAVNGLCCDAIELANVAPGKKAVEKIEFSSYDFDGNAIGAYTDIEMNFRVYDNENWDKDDIAYESVRIYPYGEDKAVKFVREAQDSDNVIVDNDIVSISVIGYTSDEYGYYAHLYVVNKTDKCFKISIDDASVNGFMADPYFVIDVLGGNSAFSTINWMQTTLEENDITSVEEIEFTLTVYDEENYMEDAFVDEVITLNP